MNLRLSDAFSGHYFDHSVFRELAYANFTSTQETEQAIQALNYMDLDGRKLRVEYQKMPWLAEQERIQREKCEGRGQLEVQHRRTQLHGQTSLPSVLKATPSYLSSTATAQPPVQPPPPRRETQTYHANVDMNATKTLEFYFPFWKCLFSLVH